MTIIQRNRLNCDLAAAEARVMLASATATPSGNQADVETDNQNSSGRPRRERTRDGNREGSGRRDTSVRPDARPTNAPSTGASQAGVGASQRQSGTANLGAIGLVRPVNGARDPIAIDAGPTVTDITSADARTLRRTDGGTSLGFVTAGDSIFVTIPTRESITARRSLERDIRESGADRDQAIDDLIASFQSTVDAALLNGFNSASTELVDNPNLTLAPERAQQIENNRVARVAERNQSVSFVSNAVQRNADDSVTLFFNAPNPEIDLLDSPDGAPSFARAREPRSFTFEEITSGRLSQSAFGPGDTLTIPANIINEGFRLLDASNELNVETSVLFNADGSTFSSPELIEELGAPSLGDGSTITGDFDGLDPLNERANFTGGTENTVADLHTHPPLIAAFRPFADDFEQGIEDEFSAEDLAAEGLSDPFANQEVVDIFTGTADFGVTDPATLTQLLVDEEVFNSESEEDESVEDESVEDESLDDGDELLNAPNAVAFSFPGEEDVLLTPADIEATGRTEQELRELDIDEFFRVIEDAGIIEP